MDPRIRDPRSALSKVEFGGHQVSCEEVLGSIGLFFSCVSSSSIRFGLHRIEK